MHEQAAAFFDLDRTLMRENSGALYAMFEYRNGRIGMVDLVKSSYWLLLHHLTLLDVDSVYRKAAAHWQGQLGEDVRVSAAEWFARDVQNFLTPGGRRALAMHKERGEPTVLLSNTSGYIAMAATACWGIDHWLANIIPVDQEGRITGGIDTPLCYGPGKVTRAEAWAAANGVSLEKSYFYSDSLSDMPMLTRVGQPRVVNPDPMLKRVAKKRGWQVLDWRQ